MEKEQLVRHDWTKEELLAIYNQPLMGLVYRAASVHRLWHHPEEVQVATLLSVKTGGCPEDCSYCGQAARYHTDIKVQALLPTDTVLAHARKAKENGASRFCMAAAWREVRDNRDFDRIIDMVKGVNELGLEVCCTLRACLPKIKLNDYKRLDFMHIIIILTPRPTTIMRSFQHVSLIIELTRLITFEKQASLYVLGGL